MPTFSGGKDKSENRDQPFTGDGKSTSNDRLPAKGEITVRTKDGSAQLKSTNDLFGDKAKDKRS